MLFCLIPENLRTDLLFCGLLEQALGRELALLLSFAQDQGKTEPEELLLAMQNAEAGAEGEEIAEFIEASEEVRNFAMTLVIGSFQKRRDLDKTISEHLASGWSLARISLLEKSVLRLAAFELLYTEALTRNVIVDFLDLVSDYSPDQTVKFVHGVLSAIDTGARPRIPILS